MRTKFRINPESLEIQKININRITLLKYVIHSIFFAILFAIIVFFSLKLFLPDPVVRKYQQELRYLEDNYDITLQKIQLAYKLIDSLKIQERHIYKLTFETDTHILFVPEATTSMEKQHELMSAEDILITTDSLLIEANKKLLYFTTKINQISRIILLKQTLFKKLPGSLPLAKGTFTIVSGFGKRIHPMLKTVRPHNGIDLVVRQGSPVYATGDGIVIETPFHMNELGNVVVIDHGNGITSIYGCLLKPEVKVGTRVRRGDIIGYSGKSGIALGPHLHYEVRIKNKPVNPVNFFFLDLKPIEFHEILRKSSIYNQSMS